MAGGIVGPVPLAGPHAFSAKGSSQESHQALVVGEVRYCEIFREKRQQFREVAAAVVALGTDGAEIAG